MDEFEFDPEDSLRREEAQMEANPNWWKSVLEADERDARAENYAASYDEWERKAEKYGKNCRHCGKRIRGDDSCDECDMCRRAWDSLLTD